MARKRVILAKGPHLLQEMFQRVLNKADNLEVVWESPTQAELPSAIERFQPEWVILSVQGSEGTSSLVNICMTEYSAVRFVLLSPEDHSVKMKWQTSYEEELTNLSLEDFIHILEKDPQHT